MIKKIFIILPAAFLFNIVLPRASYTDTEKFLYQKSGDMLEQGIDRSSRYRIRTGDILKTHYSKIEYLTSQVSGIGHGRPGTEEFLNADVLVKLRGDDNIYGLSSVFFDSQEHGPNRLMFDMLLSALVNDLRVEISYYNKEGAKQIIKISTKK